MSKLTRRARAHSLAAGAVAVALAGFAVASPALAQGRPLSPGASPVSLRIGYADLNLASSSGRATLKRRVWSKVHRMCRGGESSFQPTLQDLRCRTSAWVQAAPQIRLAVERARGVASTGASPIAASAIVIAPEPAAQE